MEDFTLSIETWITLFRGGFEGGVAAVVARPFDQNEINDGV